MFASSTPGVPGGLTETLSDGLSEGLSGAFDQALVPRAQVDCRAPDAVARLRALLGDAPFALVVIFVSPQADFRAIMAEAHSLFGGTTTIGCTTAGEIGQGGYDEGTMLAVGLPQDHFRVATHLIENLDHLDKHELISRMITRRSQLTAGTPDWAGEFAFLLIDGLSRKEDAIVAACSNALGPVPLFGGSAGDGEAFDETLVALNGQVMSNAAVLTYVRTDCPVKVFTIDHFTPTDQRMVVTSADPIRRVVHQINAEPAAREYARILGKDPDQLDTYTFAAHPVVVRFGGAHHVRSILHVQENDLVFFAAIEEGLVLTLAEPTNMAEHLETALDALGTPSAILGCDCILRRMEAQEKQMTRTISDILVDRGVVGFSTYGEQYSGMHVNQTLTGVAIYPPGTKLP